MHLAGATVSVLSPLPKGYCVEKLDFVKSLPFNVEYLEEGCFSSVLPSYSKLWRKKILALQSGVDIFHINGLFDHFSVLAPLVLSKPYVLSVRGSLMREAFNLGCVRRVKKNAYMHLVGNRIVEKAMAIHVMCEEELQNFVYFFPKLCGKVRIVPNGIDLKDFDISESTRDLGDRFPQLKGKPYVLFMGRLHPIKGLDVLIKAFKMLSARNDLLLVLAGPDTDGYAGEVRRQVSVARLDEKVVFTGMLSGTEKIGAIKRAKAFVLSSYSENFGMAVVEAMACGTPVVVSDKVGIYREIRANKAGVVSGVHPNEIARALSYVLDRDDLSHEISANAKRLVSHSYDIDIVANAMLRLYKDVRVQ